MHLLPLQLKGERKKKRKKKKKTFPTFGLYFSPQIGHLFKRCPLYMMVGIRSVQKHKRNKVSVLRIVRAVPQIPCQVQSCIGNNNHYWAPWFPGTAVILNVAKKTFKIADKNPLFFCL